MKLKPFLLTTLLPALTMPLAANDLFADAIALDLDTTTFPVSGNTEGATREDGEPLHGAITVNVPNASLWYSLEVDEAIRVELSVTSSGLDSAIGVYTGDSVNALTNISRYADLDFPALTLRRVEPFVNFARLNFDAVPGTTYYIAIDGEGNRGPFGLTLAPSRDPHNPTDELIPPMSNWSSLIARDEIEIEGAMVIGPVNPADLDPDFFTTWTRDNASYDGPAFSALGPVPTGYGNVSGAFTRVGTDNIPFLTPLWNPAGEEPQRGLRYTSYHRTSFTPATTITGLGFEGLFDDGAIVYVNGNEVGRMNVGEDADANDWQTLAELLVIPGVGDTENVIQYLTASDVVLPAGAKVDIAVSLHNQSANSTDMGFDMRVWALGGGGVVIPFTPDFLINIAATENPDEFELTWPSADDETYQIQFNADLEGNWINVFANPIMPSGTGMNTRLVFTGGSKGFWRVIIL